MIHDHWEQRSISCTSKSKSELFCIYSCTNREFLSFVKLALLCSYAQDLNDTIDHHHSKTFHSSLSICTSFLPKAKCIVSVLFLLFVLANYKLKSLANDRFNARDVCPISTFLQSVKTDLFDVYITKFACKAPSCDPYKAAEYLFAK